MTVIPVMINAAPAASSQMDRERAANIEAWTEQAVEALQSVSLHSPSQPMPRGTSVRLSIPLDAAHPTTAGSSNEEEDELSRDAIRRQRTTTNNAYGRREPIRRDSLKRREALLKGKEGSRQRRRWENDRLLNNPWAQPPLPMDWEVQPTHRKHAVPYYLAQLWDESTHLQKKTEQRRRRLQKDKPDDMDPASRVPKEVRAKLRHARAAKGLLQDLEEDVRVFLQKWNEKRASRREEGLEDMDSDEDEIVFVGRNGSMHDSPSSDKKKAYQLEDLRREKLVFDTLADDRSAGFGRWLVHSIATYYGLQTWSVTVGDPARREAYVGIMDEHHSGRIEQPYMCTPLPRPLWGLV